MRATDPTDQISPQASRRQFLGSCGAGVALACASGSLAATPDGKPTRFARVALIDANGAAIRCDALAVNREYIFHYPFRSTPCFLINLGEPVQAGLDLDTAGGGHYTWQGGTGSQQSVVAFSAICSHKLSHPSPEVSFIGYREQPVGFYNRTTNAIEQRSGIIQCCSEQSVYDPAHGARVIAGPAPQPLAAIELQEVDGALHATGVYGGALFERYFEQFGNRLMIQHRSENYALPVEGQSVVIAGEQFSRNRISCG